MRTRSLFCLTIASMVAGQALAARPWSCGHWVRGSGGKPVLELGLVTDHAYVVGSVQDDYYYQRPPMDFEGYYPYSWFAALGGQIFPQDPQGAGFGAGYSEGNRLRFWWEKKPSSLVAGALVNVSSRATLAPGGRVILGFVVDQPGTRFLLRAVGPGLAAFGVESFAGNPRLTLFRGSQRIVENDDAGLGMDNTEELRSARRLADDLRRQGIDEPYDLDTWAKLWRLLPDPAAFAPLRMAGGRVGAFALAENTLDAAVVVELDAGAYTMIIDSATPGEVLGEAYEVGP